ncbi:MAG: 30S ribosomal protein S18 [Miltoncostaeaceae bacterium]
MAKPRGRGRVKKKKGGAPAPRKRRPLLAPEELDWKNFPSLRRFLSERGKLRSRRITGLSRRQQTQLAQAVKRARIMGLLPYPDQDRSVKAHRAANPVPAAAPEVAPADASAEAPATDAPEVEVTEVVEEPVAVGAGDAEERAE